MKNLIFVAGHGRVYALDKIDGSVRWEVMLKKSFWKLGNDLVTLLETPELLYAFAYGTLYCLGKSDGKILWETQLKHLKHHIAVMATDGLTNSMLATALASEHERQQDSSTTAAGGNGD